MAARFLTEFQRDISQARFDPYRKANSTDFDAMVDYYWNIALSEALYPSLATLEVILRNTLHDTFSRQHGSDFWFRTVLEPSQLREYSRVHTDLVRNGLKNPTSGKIVAELNFWFWTSMLSSLYQGRWENNKYTLLHGAFPNMPPMPAPRREIYNRCNDIRLLRNRVMHHEPILQGMTFQRDKKQTTTFSIDQLHIQIIEIIDWISQTAKRTLECLDRFDEVFINGRTAAANAIRTEFGIAP